MTLALPALLILALAVLIWRAVVRDRHDYARFKRLRSTQLRRRVFARWIRESWLVLGGLGAVLLLATWPFVADALVAIRSWGPFAGIDFASPTVALTIAVVLLAGLAGGTLPILLLRHSVEEVPAVGDIRALLPRNRGELPYGAGLAVTAGIVEEVLFRLALPALLFGITQDALVAFLGAAVVFGVLHVYQGPLGMLFAFVLGLVFTALYVATGTIVVPILAHALIDLRSLVLIPVVLGRAAETPPPAAGSPTRSAPRPPDPEASEH
ncbi:MAG: type II CAAX endopeptidase family protein [Schumannella sp.]|nr:CPBP family intramembrane metalloprotease [Microbacteriaceae bacterium]